MNDWSADDIRELAKKGLTKEEMAEEIGITTDRLNKVLSSYPRLTNVIMRGREKAREEGGKGNGN